MTVTNVNTFRYHLTRGMFNRHISFVELEADEFRALLKSLNSSVEDYLVKTGNSIRNWVEDDFIEAKRLIREEVLARAISKIHISCDSWTSPNGFAMCGVAAHFIAHHGHVQTVLLALKRMTGAHGGEQIVEVIIAVFMEYDFAERLGVYFGDNADSNDTAWRATLGVLHTLIATRRPHGLAVLVTLLIWLQKPSFLARMSPSRSCGGLSYRPNALGFSDDEDSSE